MGEVSGALQRKNRIARKRAASPLRRRASPNSSAQKGKSGRDWLGQGALALLAAVLASGITGFVSLAVQDNQTKGSFQLLYGQESAQRAKELRAKRAEVYFRFSDNANDYWLAVKRLERQCFSQKGDALGACVVTRMRSADFLEPRSRFQGSVNEMYVYGSKDAYTAATKVAAALPPSVGNLPLDSPVAMATTLSIESDEFASSFNAFLDVMRDELPPAVLDE